MATTNIQRFDGDVEVSGTVTGNGSGLTSLNGTRVTTGIVAAARVANLDASKITSGTLGTARIPNLDAGKITTGTLGRPISTTTGVFTSSGNAVLVGTGGKLGLTINDGDGNCNLTFNHASRLPDQDGSSGRIDCGVDGTSGVMRLRVKNSVTSGTSTGNLPECMRIEEGYVRAHSDFYADGDVGIGTTSPAYTLDVHGNANVGALTTTSISGDGSGLTNILSSSVNDFSSNVTRIAALESGDLTIGGEKTFSSNLEVGTANLFVDTVTGNVGIGTASPSVKLHVDGDVRMKTLSTNAIGKITPVYARGTGSNNYATRLVKIGDTTHVNNGSRGLTLTIINASTHAHVSSTNYDTYGSTTVSNNLATALEAMTDAQIGILTSSDAFENNMTGNLVTACLKLGLTRLAGANDDNLRHPYCAIFYGPGASGVPGNHALEVMKSDDASGAYATLSTFLIDDSFIGQTLTNALYSGTGDATTPTVIVDRNENVGIGTTSPDQKLEVHGNILLGNNDVNSFIHGGASAAMSADTNILIVADSNDTSGAAPAGNIIFGSGSAVDTNQNRDFTYAQAYPSNVPRNEHMRIRGDGNVGIGTTDPMNTGLHIANSYFPSGGNTTHLDPQIFITGDSGTGGNQVSAIGFSGNSVGDTHQRMVAGSVYYKGGGGNYGMDGYLGIAVANSSAGGSDPYGLTEGELESHTRIAIKNNGNVGIGTTSPDLELHVHDANNATSGIILSSTSGYHRFYEGSGQLYIQSGTAASADSRADIHFTSMYNSTSYMKIRGSNGNVGIGTTDPGGKLDVVASTEGDYIARFKNSSVASDEDARIVIEASDAGGESQILLQTTNESTTHKWNITTGSGITPSFGFQYDSSFNGGTWAMIIKHGGNVGIGTNNPGFKLEVNGTMRHDGLSMSSGTTVDQLTTIEKSLTITEAWMETGIKATNLATGTYIVQIYNVSDYGSGGGNYEETYSGIMSWFDGNTNSTEATEIPLTAAGHAPNGNHIYLRVMRTLSADTNNLKLQIRKDTSMSSAYTYTFEFRRMI